MLGNKMTKIYIKELDKFPPISDPGDFDYKDASELDNVAYGLYIKENNEKAKNSDSWVYYTQTGFVDSVGSEVYYDKATIILRTKKIDVIKNK